MNMKVAFPALFFLASVAFPPYVFAWGDQGHKIVALVAYHYLDEGVRAKVDSMLATDDSQLVGGTDIANEATWADRYRDSDRNGSKVRYYKTREWHFVDIDTVKVDIPSACFQFPKVPEGTPASDGPSKDCIIDKIEQFTKELGDPETSAEERRLALQFLLHFVGDLHQPLHASTDNDDHGGNKKCLSGHTDKSCGRTYNLHHYWDSVYVGKLGKDPQKVADQLVEAAQQSWLTAWRKGTPTTWARQSFTVAKQTVYGMLPAAEPDGTYVLTDAYEVKARQVVSTQLLRGGVRLAHVLNAALR